MSLKPNVGQYPEKFTFWNQGEQKRLQVINAEDFPYNEILSWLKIANHDYVWSFGITDAQEIRNRISVMKYLNDNSKVTSQLMCLLHAAHPILPKDKNQFIDFYDSARAHNPFWGELIDLLNQMEKTDMPPKMQQFYDTLKSFRGLEGSEREMVKAVNDILESTAVMEGVLDVELGVEFVEVKKLEPGYGDAYDGVADKGGETKEMKKATEEPSIRSSYNQYFEQFFGHRTFSYALSAAREKDIPDWAERWYTKWNIGPVLKLIYAYWNEQQKKKAYRGMTIETCCSIAKDINDGVIHLLYKQDEQVLRELAKVGSGLCFKVYFSYGKYDDEDCISGAPGTPYEMGTEGLRIRILDIFEKTAKGGSFTFDFSCFAGYSKERKEKIGRGRKKISECIRRYHENRTAYEIQAGIQEKAVELYSAVMKIDSPATDTDHKWLSLENLYESEDLAPVCEALKTFKAFVYSHLKELDRIYVLLRRFKEKADQIGTTICFPEILSGDENIVEFSNLYPMHLGKVLKNGKIVPINNLTAINGNMIGLTGRHGGGKTVTEHTITGNIFLAQSGLPVFGKSFRLNPKTHLGMVFIDGVSGKSVAQVLMEKMKKVFKETRRVPGKDVVLVLDELGSATQEKDGCELALKILEAMHRKRVSLLFSTQILDVAEKAEIRFGAKCFRVDKKHRLLPGIGSGELSALVKEVGLSKYLR